MSGRRASFTRPPRAARRGTDAILDQLLDDLADGVELGDLDEGVGNRLGFAAHHAVNELKITERGSERAAAVGLIAPAFAVLEAQYRKEADQRVIDRWRAGWANQSDAFNHVFEGIRDWPSRRRPLRGGMGIASRTTGRTKMAHSQVARSCLPNPSLDCLPESGG